MIKAELKKGSAELMILAILDEGERHGYEIGKLIEERSHGELRFHVASLYPVLYRLEKRGWINGRWERRAGRRRRAYRLTLQGRSALASERRSWRAFLTALNRVARIRHA